MGGRLATFLFFLIISLYCASSASLAVPRDASLSELVCPEKDKSGNALGQSNAESFAGSTPVYLCVYSPGASCQYLPTDGVAYGVLASSCPAVLRRLNGPGSSTGFHCNPKDLSGEKIVYTDSSKTPDGSATITCNYGSSSQCQYLTSGDLLEDAGHCPDRLAPNEPDPDAPVSASNGSGGSEGAPAPTTSLPRSLDTQLSSSQPDFVSSISSVEPFLSQQSLTPPGQHSSTPLGTPAPPSPTVATTLATTSSAPPTALGKSSAAAASTTSSSAKRIDSTQLPASATTPAAPSSPSPSSSSTLIKHADELSGSIIGLIVAGCVVLFGLASFVVWRRTHLRRRLAAKLAAEQPAQSSGVAYFTPSVSARGSAKSLAAARRDALATQSSGAMEVEPTRRADTYVGQLAAEVRRALAEYGAPPPPAYGVGTDASPASV